MVAERLQRFYGYGREHGEQNAWEDSVLLLVSDTLHTAPPWWVLPAAVFE